MLRRLRSERTSSMRNLKTRLTYANVMSTIAVFLALGGGSLAAVSGDKPSGDKGAQHSQGDGSGGNSGGDQGGKGDKGGNSGGDQGGKGDKGGNSGGKDSQGDKRGNGAGTEDAGGDGALSVTTGDGDAVSTDRHTDEA